MELVVTRCFPTKAVSMWFLLTMWLHGERMLVSANDDNANTCTLYMAPSSIPNAGYGIFTVRPFRSGEVILSNDGPNIPVLDVSQIDGPHMGLFDNVWWGYSGGMSDEMAFESVESVDFQITFGAMPNYHTMLFNIDFQQPDLVLNDSLADRNVDPGAGSFSYYLGKDFYAARDVESGDELFLDYGEHWLKDRPDFKHVPRAKDFKKAGSALSLLSDLFYKTGEMYNTSCSAEGANETSDHDVLNAILKTARTMAEVYSGARASSVLPRTPDELRLVFSNARSSNPDDLAHRLARDISVNSRSVEWIVENGFCLDNIIAGDSKISEAKRGAIARRDLSKGATIIPTPLLHVLDKDVFSTLPVQPDADGALWRDRQYAKEQLLTNYCFSHEQSSFMLCPVTNMVLINHCSERTRDCGADGPNAKIQWADWDDATKQWLTRSLEAIAETNEERLLFLEVVATRDIQAGEEIYIDYGVGWETAWSEYVANWQPPGLRDGFERHVSATEMNEKQVPPHLNSDLRYDRPSSFGDVFTACLYWEDDAKDNLLPTTDVNWQDLDDEEILSRYSVSVREYLAGWDGKSREQWPCSVVSKDEETYTVRILQSPMQNPTPWSTSSIPRFVTDLPRAFIRYVTKPYRSDVHLPGAFRHFIEIPNEMFPTQWKNRNKATSKVSGALFRLGDRVEAFLDDWFTGKVDAVSTVRTYGVEFEDGVVEEHVHESAMRHPDVSDEQRRRFAVGDKVGIDIENRGESLEGTVLSTETLFSYDIVFDDGEKIDGVAEMKVREINYRRFEEVSKRLSLL